jgi:hypothetical protein
MKSIDVIWYLMTDGTVKKVIPGAETLPQTVYTVGEYDVPMDLIQRYAPEGAVAAKCRAGLRLFPRPFSLNGAKITRATFEKLDGRRYVEPVTLQERLDAGLR